MKSASTQKKLLAEPDLTFERALAIAISLETATRDASELQQKAPECTPNPVNWYQRQSCVCCGKSSHDVSQCWFKDKVCRKCKKRGHIERMCQSGKTPNRSQVLKVPGRKYTTSQVHKVANNESDSTDSTGTEKGLCSLEMHSMTAKERQVIWVTLEVAGIDLKMELDTGSALSMLNESDYKHLFAAIPLKKTSVTLRTYTGELVSQLGKIKVYVKYKGNAHKLYLYILPHGGPALLGREWIRKIQLDWHSIHRLQSTASDVSNNDATIKELSKLLAAAQPIFQPGIGTLKDIKASIELDPHAVPKFCKARTAPYAIRPAVEEELRKLEDSGILSPVEWSEWATPIVPIVKKDKVGTIRICGDFKMIINPVLRTVQYPLPKIEGIFSALSGGDRFSKIDLAQGTCKWK
ncbi:uncharacterized protein K02A2.6-like [Pseudophryne corroboree]|uniref:uncharacterized protein K02A2.6-like n=1 Tax=Pseudophryne corroboree TaxID=495146 RepID=UPI00308177BB